MALIHAWCFAHGESEEPNREAPYKYVHQISADCRTTVNEAMEIEQAFWHGSVDCREQLIARVPRQQLPRLGLRAWQWSYLQQYPQFAYQNLKTTYRPNEPMRPSAIFTPTRTSRRLGSADSYTTRFLWVTDLCATAPTQLRIDGRLQTMLCLCYDED